MSHKDQTYDSFRSPSGIFNFPSGEKLQAERFSPFDWQMKTACDHFFIITMAEILGAAKHQSDSMAARHERVWGELRQKGMNTGGNRTERQACKKKIKRYMREGRINGSRIWQNNYDREGTEKDRENEGKGEINDKKWWKKRWKDRRIRNHSSSPFTGSPLQLTSSSRL